MKKARKKMRSLGYFAKGAFAVSKKDLSPAKLRQLQGLLKNRRKRRVSERRAMQIKRGLMKRARKLRLGAKRTGAYVYGTLRRIVGNPGGRYRVGGGYKTFTLDEAKREAERIFRTTGNIVSIEEHRPTPQVAPTWKYGIYTGRGVVRKNPGRLHKNLIIANKMWYSVYLHGKKIDDVQYTGVSGNNKAEREQYVYRSLVGHDGYDPAIVVKEDRLVKNPARGLRRNRRRTVRKNPASKARPIPGKFYRVYWSHPSRGETGQITFTGDQLLKIKSVTELSRYWPIKEGLKMAKVHFRGPYDSWDDAFMDR